MNNVSRKSGGNAVAAYAYMTGEPCRDLRTGALYRFGRRERVVAVSDCPLPNQAESGLELWQDLEQTERAANARIAKRIEVALPRGWSVEQMRGCVDAYIADNLAPLSVPCSYAIHTDAEGDNPHAHILVANRALNESGKWKPKTKTVYELDAEGNRIPRIDPATGEQMLGKRNERLWKRKKVQANPLDDKQTLLDLRQGWEQTLNARLAPERQVSRLSNAERGVKALPTVHVGWNAKYAPARRIYNDLVRKINDLMRQIARRAVERLREIKIKPFNEMEKEVAIEESVVAPEATGSLLSADVDEISTQTLTDEEESHTGQKRASLFDRLDGAERQSDALNRDWHRPHPSNRGFER